MRSAECKTGEALDIIDQWLTNIEDPSLESVKRGKLTEAVDACFNGDGSVQYAGPDAWDGILNEEPPGPCTTAFPIYSTSRIEAGGDMKGNVFKCQLKSVETALADGTYVGVDFSETQKTRLKEIFTMGVCDYSKPDVGIP